LIKKILKKNIPELLNDNKFWSNSFLSITKHRLYSHYLNPYLDDNDVVLLLALKNGEIVGYMGVFVDYINIEKKECESRLVIDLVGSSKNKRFRNWKIFTYFNV